MNNTILIISQYYYPESFRINDLSIEWIKKGYSVTVLTGIPNYPTGSFFKGYSLFKKRKEKHNGVSIIRLPIIPRGKNRFMLAFNYLSFVISSWFWVALNKTKFHSVFVFGVSPLTQALPGLWYSRKHQTPLILYLQDLWPENLEVVGKLKNKYLLKIVSNMMGKIYRHSKYIVVPSKSFMEVLKNKGVDNNKIIYIPQYAEDFYIPLKTNFRQNNDPLKIIFTGNIGFAQGLDLLPKVALLLKNEGFSLKIKFILVGNGRFKNDLVFLIKKYNLEKFFELHDAVPPMKIPKMLSEADVTYLSFSDNKLFDKTIPAKLQSYLACGMPILAAVGGETKSLVEYGECGYVSPTNNVKLLYDNIIKFYHLKSEKIKEMSQRSLFISNQLFNKDSILSQFELIFKEANHA
jgi:glycosyltransferase involved in cell wall biosynthesis